ncbi:MAG: hypothetical protein RL354_508, partial [Planctomycetota bacterium]
MIVVLQSITLAAALAVGQTQ